MSKYNKNWNRKMRLMAIFVLLSTGGYFGVNLQAKDKIPEIIVYKSPTCGCCENWVKHLKDAGFKVEAINKRNMNIVKSQFGVKQQYQSCHTAKIGKYFIEGHVPASDIKKLLAEAPDARGLAVPGMPIGSPGMEGPRKDKYSVLLIDNQNQSMTYSQY